MDRIAGAWQSRTRREQLLAVALVVLLLGAACFLLVGAGEEPVAAAGSTTDPALDANPDGTSGTTEVEPGTIVATPVRPAPPAAAPGGVAPLNVSAPSGGSGGSGGAVDAQTERVNGLMNRLWKDVPALRVDEPPPTTNGVAYAGSVLELTARRYNECIRKVKDHYDCLEVVPEGVEIDRIFDSGEKGLAISRDGDGQVVRLVFRGDVMCRMLGEAPSCGAWSAGG